MKRDHSIGVTQSRAAYSIKVASSDLVIGLSIRANISPVWRPRKLVQARMACRRKPC